MDKFLDKILKVLKEFKIKPVIYGSFGVSNYLGNFKDFEDIDILVEDEYIGNKWVEFKKLFESKGFSLINEKEHEFELNGKKVGFASKNILVRDKIINDYSELVKYKDEDALTLTPEGFLKAYKFSVKDGYRIDTRGKKDLDIINKLEIYIKKLYSVIVNSVIVNSEGKVLIAQRSFKEGHEGGKWSIPGGKIESTGEEHDVLLKNIKKEILEEVGVEIYNDIVLVHDNTFTRNNCDEVLALVFRCKYKSGEAKPLEDTVDVKWITKEELDSYQFPLNVKEYVLGGFL